MLMRIDPNPELVDRTLEMAAEDLAEGERSLDEGRLAWALVQLYTSMLNFARALMFKKGIREKSHQCTVEYLKANHGDEYGYLLHAFDSLRRERHSMLYDSRESISEEKVRQALEWGHEFEEVTLDIVQKK